MDQDDEPEESQADSAMDSEAEVNCPYCGEAVVIALDTGGGLTQEYVEDCQVCCRPWRVRVHFHGSGMAEVEVEPAQ